MVNANRMNTLVKTALLAGLAVLLGLVQQINAKSLKDLMEVKCLCKITSGATTFQNLGTIELYTVKSGWTKKLCHDVRLKCRDDCDKRVKKQTETAEGKLYKAMASGEIIGRHFCKKFGHVTADGPVHLQSESFTPGCAHKVKKGHWKTDLCCGSTFVSKDGVPERVLAWNPDCEASTYYIVH